jgi:hypothetical protein
MEMPEKLRSADQLQQAKKFQWTSRDDEAVGNGGKDIGRDLPQPEPIVCGAVPVGEQSGTHHTENQVCQEDDRDDRLKQGGRSEEPASEDEAGGHLERGSQSREIQNPRPEFSHLLFRNTHAAISAEGDRDVQ